MPVPTFAGQSPGRGDGVAAGVFGAPGNPGAADDEPQLANEVPIPIAAIVLNMAELPTARPTDVRNSRRAIRLLVEVMQGPRCSDYLMA